MAWTASRLLTKMALASRCQHGPAEPPRVQQSHCNSLPNASQVSLSFCGTMLSPHAYSLAGWISVEVPLLAVVAPHHPEPGWAEKQPYTGPSLTCTRLGFPLGLVRHSAAACVICPRSTAHSFNKRVDFFLLPNAPYPSSDTSVVSGGRLKK